MLELLKRFWFILTDERGEDNPAGADGQAGAPGDAGEGAAPAGESGFEEGEGGQGDQTPPANPKYGEFGDNPTPDQLFEAYTKLKGDAEGYKGKITATERNLASTRKALEGSGIRAVQGEDGNIKLELIEPAKSERKTKFNDEAIKKLAVHFQNDPEAARGFTDVIRLAVQDEIDSWYENMSRTSTTKQQQMRQMAAEQASVNSRMIKLYPALDPKFDDNGKPANANFNQAFYDRATEIWAEKYGKHPLKEIYAAMDAADELGISSGVIEKAKVEGFQAGKTGKKILGPAGGGKGPQGGAAGKLSREEILAMPKEKREAYEKQQLGI